MNPARYISLIFKVTTLGVMVFVISACASNPVPAPVIDVTKSSKKIHQRTAIIGYDTVKVEPGDTLYSIAFNAGMDYRKLAQINNIKAPFNIFVGQVINLTGGGKTVKNSSPNTDVSASKKGKNRADNETGMTSKKGVNKTVDQNKKQEYGLKESKQNVNKTVNRLYASADKSRTRKSIRWSWPTKGKVVEKFSLKEVGNKGIDIAGRNGQEIYAAADGKVVYAGNALRGFGNLIIVKHSEEYLSAYAHNSKLLVKETQEVRKGQLVALMGSSDAPSTRLHFEIRYKGKSVDPMNYLPKK